MLVNRGTATCKVFMRDGAGRSISCAVNSTDNGRTRAFDWPYDSIDTYLSVNNANANVDVTL